MNPTNDGLPPDAVLAEFLYARETDQSSKRGDWVSRYPGLAEFFDAERELSPLFSPLRNAFQAPPLVGGGEPVCPVLDGYQIIEEIGRGGMGIVYKARDMRIDRVEAIKILLPDAQMSHEARLRLEEEAKLVARLDHPGIVRLYLLGDYQGWPYLRLEFVPGGSLAERLRCGPLSSRTASRLVERLAQAVQFAHAAGVIHRDLKPSNVLMGLAGDETTAKITDFGLARELGRPGRLSLSGTVLGSAGYMAPEQARAEEAGPAADVYGLGAILYECLTGRPPFDGETAIDTVLKSLTDAVLPPRALAPSVDPKVEAICLRCLEKDPLHRWTSAGHLANALAALERPSPRRFRLPLVVAAGVAVVLGVGLWARYTPRPMVVSSLPVEPEREPHWPLVLHRTLSVDLEANPSARRPRLRYLTLAHLALQPESRREEVRLSLEELARWAGAPGREFSFQAINEDRMIYRFDLAGISSTPKPFWDAVLEADPYSLQYDGSAVRGLREAEANVRRLAMTPLAHVRADWFLARAGRWFPPQPNRTPLPEHLEAMAKRYDADLLTLTGAARELELADDTDLRNLLTNDDSQWSRSLKPLLQGGFIPRRTWESLDVIQSPFQYISGELGLGTPARCP